MKTNLDRSEILTSAIRRALTISYLPEPFRKMAIKAELVNQEILKHYSKLKSAVGKEKADETMNVLRKEAAAGCEVNHEYIIRKLKSLQRGE